MPLGCFINEAKTEVFLGASTAPTDPKRRCVRHWRPSAGDKRIQTLDAMHQAGIQQKIESPVDGGWEGSSAFWAEGGKKVVGFHGPVGLDQQLQGPPARLGQARSGRFTARLGLD